jgi:hypothetical protein
MIFELVCSGIWGWVKLMYGYKCSVQVDEMAGNQDVNDAQRIRTALADEPPKITNV